MYPPPAGRSNTGEVISLSFGPVTSEKVVGESVVLAAEVKASAHGLVVTIKGCCSSEPLMLLRRLRRSLKPLAEESRIAALRLNPRVDGPELESAMESLMGWTILCPLLRPRLVLICNDMVALVAGREAWSSVQPAGVGGIGLSIGGFNGTLWA